MTSPGTMVGPYVILGRLGAGGMGEVHLARDPRLEREVALKMLPATFANDSERMALFRSEALTLAAINHPNIATVFGLEEPRSGEYALVMERVEGESLAERLRGGALPIAEALRVGVQVAEALEAAHKRNVIHRDLKPGNVMLGPGGLVKILDFGLAKSTGWNSKDSGAERLAETRAMTQPSRGASHASSAVVDENAPTSPLLSSSGSSGTPGYMSPEQVRGEAQDARTDVFAFGCVLFECLSGKRAFSGGSDLDTMAAILREPPNWELVPRQAPARIRELLTRCLDKDRERRPASMREVRLEIEEVLGIRRASALRAGEAVAVPNNLPWQPTSFVGRERAIEECLELQRASRLLTVTGVGGSGKTRLALRLAEQLLPEFPDGVWLVDLAPITDPERVPQTAASAMGVREEPGSSITEAIARSIADKRILLVLDNCEHVLGPCAALAAQLFDAASDLRVIATSREALGLRGERTYPVPSLSMPGAGEAGDAQRARAFESIQLFVDRATQVARDFALTNENSPVIVEICRRLDGIPLAIELAAARVRMLSVEQIRAKLHDRFRLLAGGSKAALARHQTLHATIQWSYDHLTSDEQEFLRALSVFMGGWTLEAAVAVCANGRDEFEVLDLLTRLEDKSLMVVERSETRPPRYRFLETVRQYGRGILVERGESDALRGSHRDWFLALAERAAEQFRGPDQAVWLDRLEIEMDNLRAALDWCFEQDSEVASVLRMTAAINWLWLIRGYFNEGRERLEAAVERSASAEPSPELATVLHAAGNVCFRLDSFDEARGYYERALTARERLGDRRGMAGSLGALGNVAQYQGRYPEAMELFQRSLTINREIGYKVWEAANLNCLGNCSRLLEDFTNARAYLDQAVALNREIGNRNGESTSLDGLGCLLLQMGDRGAAHSLFEQALAIEREIGSLHEEAVTLSGLARVARDEGDLGRARSLVADAIRLMRRMGARLQIAANLEDLARLVSLESRTERAVRGWAAAHVLRESIGAPADPADRKHIEQALDAARASMGEAAFESAWQRGARMGLDEAIVDALGDAPM